MSFNRLKLELRYCSPFWNVSTINEVMVKISQNSRQNSLPWQRPLRDRKVIYQVIKPFYTPNNPEILVKIGPLDTGAI